MSAAGAVTGMRRGLAGLACVGLLGLLTASDPGGTARAASAGGSGGGTQPTTGNPSPSSSSAPPSPPPVLAAPIEGAPQTAAGIARTLARPLSDPRLGPRVAATVVDAATGQVLLDRGAGTYATPASTAKLATAVALLATTPADRQLSTQVVRGARPGEVVLVGGGDPTLSAAPAGRRPAYEGAPRIISLAAAVRRAGVYRPSRVVVDATLFSGPRLAPSWDPADVVGGYVAPISALTLDGGRRSPGSPARLADPDLAAGRALAAALGVPGASVVRGKAPAGAAALGEVRSQPIGRVVEQMLLASDNVLADTLVRQVALAERQPASFAGASAAVRRVLGRLGLPAAGGRLVDGSGLSLQDRITPALLAALLRAAVSPDRPELHGVLSGLPVSGYDGTLDDRFRTGAAAVAAGQVRAKTGTLNGVSALAGLVRGAAGRLLVFAVIADRVPPAGTLAAEDALDSLAATLARCGC